ncbi:hypothetical protein ACWENA_27730 [Streptomyces sp. NPDC004779]
MCRLLPRYDDTLAPETGQPEGVGQLGGQLTTAWAREQNPGPTEEERELLAEPHRERRLSEVFESDLLPMIGLAQLYRRDVPHLLAWPDGCDLLQVFWCPLLLARPGPVRARAVPAPASAAVVGGR